MKVHTTDAIYRQHDVHCSGPQLVLLLCDGAIRYARDAADHLRHERWVEKGKAVELALECMHELRKTLNLADGSDFVKDLDRNYNLLASRLTLANTSRDPGQFEQAADAIQVIRDSWSELFDRLQTEGKLQDRPIKPIPLGADWKRHQSVSQERS